VIYIQVLFVFAFSHYLFDLVASYEGAMGQHSGTSGPGGSIRDSLKDPPAQTPQVCGQSVNLQLRSLI
jgi:hypothetical protein